MSKAARIKWDASAVERQMRSATPKGIRHALYVVQNESQKQVPIGKTSALERSVTIDADENAGAISYGFEAGDYAVVQHERADFKHSRQGRKAKYLEDPINDKTVQDDMLRAMADDMTFE